MKNHSTWQINCVELGQGSSYVLIRTNNRIANAWQSMNCRNIKGCGWLTSNLRPNRKTRGFSWLISWDKRIGKISLEDQTHHSTIFLVHFLRNRDRQNLGKRIQMERTWYTAQSRKEWRGGMGCSAVCSTPLSATAVPQLMVNAEALLWTDGQFFTQIHGSFQASWI